MGVDVQIYIKVRDGASLPENDSRVEGEFYELGEWEAEDFPFANAGLSSMTRYYGVGYERGPWPDICALLLYLLMHPDVLSVWYCGDHREAHREYDLVTLDVLNTMNAHYVATGHTGYGGNKIR